MIVRCVFIFSSSQIANGSFEGAPCDVWALGVLLFQLVCGQLPFQGRSLEELHDNIRLGVVIPSRVSTGTLLTIANRSFIQSIVLFLFVFCLFVERVNIEINDFRGRVLMVFFFVFLHRMRHVDRIHADVRSRAPPHDCRHSFAQVVLADEPHHRR
jgi:serine/threonine protein kinase